MFTILIVLSLVVLGAYFLYREVKNAPIVEDVEAVEAAVQTDAKVAETEVDKVIAEIKAKV